MLIKRISCRVPPSSRARFTTTQTAWGRISDAPGFLGQTGGFSLTDPELAIIIGLWADRAAYDHFMAELHDPVFDSSGQRASYSAIEVALYTAELAMPGRRPDLSDALAEGRLLRIAEGAVKPSAIDHFLVAQRDIWRPGMAAAAGMLGGAFARMPAARERFLVTTLWTGEDAHRAYVERTLPELRRRSQVDDDVDAMAGLRVLIEPSWIVVPDS
ncbi:DUF4937 domain-containing protein [Haliangium sp.]|uniref:DUF4937 domain-containing protein n=1 Tax=Haliangium sp. TaxID=2663208 RepID=UPI003D1076DC